MMLFLSKWKSAVLVGALALTDAVGFSQTYEVVPNDTIELFGGLEDLQTLSIQQLNTSNDTLRLQWNKVSESVPPLWEASVCDNSFCETSLVQSGAMNPVFPSESGFVLLHITPHVNLGTAWIQYEVWNINTPQQRDTLSFILHVSNMAAVENLNPKNQSNVYFDPASQLMHINASELQGFTGTIYNSVGQSLHHWQIVTQNSTFGMGHLPSGIYLITMSNSDQQFTQFILKN